MSRLGRAVLAAAIALSACGSDEREWADAGGVWRLSSITLDGASIDIGRPVLLEVRDDGFRAETPCNSFGRTFGSRIVESTTELCDDETADGVPVMTIEDAMRSAIGAGPMVGDGLLRFDADGVALVYEPTSDPKPEELFSALDDPDLAVDPSTLSTDPEAGGPLEFDRLARLAGPFDGVSYLVSVRDDLVCLIVTKEATTSTCQTVVHAALSSTAWQPMSAAGPLGARVALIPDPHVVAPGWSDLGAIHRNVLVLDAATPSGVHRVRNDDGAEFVLIVT